MKKLLIDGIIGFSWYSESCVTKKSAEKQLEGLKDGEEIEITVNSQGGSVYEGVNIFNLIRDLAKTHPISVKISSIAMSMGSYIALAARTVNRNSKLTASENSIFMIHNPWSVGIGDYHAMKKLADYLEKLSALYGSVHVAISGKSEKVIYKAMDEETYYVGREIADMGFANDFETISKAETAAADGATVSGSASPESRNVLIAKAQHVMAQALKIAREACEKDPSAYYGEMEKAAALCGALIPPMADNAENGEKIISGGVMGATDTNKPLTVDDLKAQNKPIYDAVFALGETAGIDKERARVNAHLLLGEKSGSLALAAKHIKAGVSSGDETAQAEYYAAKMDAAHLTARNADNVGAVTTGGENGAAIDDAKLEKAFKDGAAGLKTGGEKWEE